MAFPTLTTSRVEPQITNILQAYTNDDFIADKVLPSVPNLKEESGKIAGIGNSHLRIYKSKRALYDEGEHRMEFTYTNDDRYQIEYYDLEAYLPDRLRDQAQAPFDVKRDATLIVMQSLMLERENALATALGDTSIVTQNTTLSGTSQFNDYVNSDPAAVIETARTTIYEATGKEANSMIISRAVFNTLKRHPFFLEMVKGVKVISGSVLIGLIQDYFEIENVYIGKTIKITSNEGQTETKSVTWGKNIILFYKPAQASILAPSFGYNFTLAGKNLRASSRRHQNDKGDLHRVDWAYQDMILDTNCGYLIKNAIA